MPKVIFVPPPPSPETIPAKKAVLLVDDDRLWLSALTKVMEGEGFAVSTATNAVAALKAVREGQVDLIVSDLNMPRMDGLELRDTLASDVQKAWIPFVFMTGSQDECDRRAAEGMGAHFVTKGEGFTRLTELVRRLATT